jgi:hypothetical protein
MKTLFKISILILVAGCSGGGNVSKIMDKPDFNEISLTCQDSTILQNISDVWRWKCDNKRLYTFCLKNLDKHFLSVYSYPDFKLLYEYGTIGQGPDDFITVNWGNTYAENGILLYDIMKKKLYPFEAGDSAVKKLNTFNLARIEGENLAKPCTMIHQINDSIFLMKVDMPEVITLEIADLKNNRQISSYAGLPQVERGRSLMYDFELEYRDNTIVRAFNYIDRIEILQIDNEYNISSKLIAGEKKLPTEYVYDPYNKLYTDVKCNGKYIFAVYQNKKNGSTVEIYDMEGNGVSKLLPDHYVEMIFISPDSDYIYAYHQLDNWDVILKYPTGL